MAICAVVGCRSRSGYTTESMFRFPKANSKYNIYLKDLAIHRLAVWLVRIGRKDLFENPAKLKHTRVCERHFISGQPSKLTDTDNPDWAPTQKLGHSYSFNYKYSSSTVQRFSATFKQTPVENNSKLSSKKSSVEVSNGLDISDESKNLQINSNEIINAESSIQTSVPEVTEVVCSEPQVETKMSFLNSGATLIYIKTVKNNQRLSNDEFNTNL